LHPTVAMLLARPSTPPEVLDAVLAAPDPPTAAAVAHQIRAAQNVATGEEPVLSLSKEGWGVEGQPAAPEQIPHNAGAAAP
ncbi:hypothetical protein NL491_28165, partial [Klebsiella pneumoniae]|nr:hypothetical protein [Klebsiella pneumoniae]